MYPFATLTRSILVTDLYALQIDRARATDGRPHVFDFNYHNFGKQSLQLAAAPYSGFPKQNGYVHLEQAQRSETSGDIHTRFDNAGTGMSLDVLGGVLSEVFQGVAPGPHPAVKVPFVIVRRRGEDVRFISFLIPSHAGKPEITASAGADGTITVQGPGWMDSVVLGAEIRFRRTSVPR